MLSMNSCWWIRSGSKTGRRRAFHTKAWIAPTRRSSRPRLRALRTISSSSITTINGSPNTIVGYPCWLAWYAGAGKERVAWNQALTSDMIFTQPVLYEFEQIRVKTLLLIGHADRTAPGSNRASPDVAARLGNYPELARRAVRMIPNA